MSTEKLKTTEPAMTDNQLLTVVNPWESIFEELPEKTLNCEVKTKDGRIFQAFRCGCHSEKCQDWRCPVTGYSLMIYDVVSWRYLNNR